MKYAIISEFDNAKLTVETNDVHTACTEFLLRAEDASHVCICDGFTGEVLCHNGDEPWCTDEMALMILGYMCAEAWGDEDKGDELAETPADPAVALLSAIFGISADEIVALHNGEGLPS